LRPNPDLSDEDAVLEKCREIARRVGTSVDELASYFYSLAFEAKAEILSAIPL